MPEKGNGAGEPQHPWLIQGGMGVAISGWRLARAVSSQGHLGVVSGTGIDTVFVRRLHDFGVDPELEQVLAGFPVPSVVERVLERYGKHDPGRGTPYRCISMPGHHQSVFAQDLLVLATYTEVALARLHHTGSVGINLLTKIELPTVPSLFGAMLAGVDYVIMGAGIPRHIPGILDELAHGRTVPIELTVSGRDPGTPLPRMEFNPERFIVGAPPRRPFFLAIVSSNALATALVRKSTGKVDGFVVEAPIAGGHNAPPRGEMRLDASGSPVYGERDAVDLEALRRLGLPFWLAGGITSASDVEKAMAGGATGVQVGTLFAFCRESGMEEGLKAQTIAGCMEKTDMVSTSPRASSTGYPFKVARVKGTLWETSIYEERTRKCDLGYLREAYLKEDGKLGYRCAAEPEDQYVSKGGSIEDTAGRMCICNGLMATAGMGQLRAHHRREPAVVTAGDAIGAILKLRELYGDYSAADVIAYLAQRGGRAAAG